MQVAFLFDNDGVLVDSSAFHWRSWCMMMGEIPEFKMSKEQFDRSFGKRNDLILEEVSPHIPSETRQKWAKRKEELFRQCARGKIKLLPGMETFLKAVVQANIPHIIASSAPIENLEMFLEATVLGQYFQHYLSAEEVKHSKPAPDIFIAAAERLGFDPKNCIVIEDAPAGIKAGVAAGCFVIALETTHQKNQLSGYDLIYPGAKELNLQEILENFTHWKTRS